METPFPTKLGSQFLVIALFYHCHSKSKLGEATTIWAALVPISKVCGL